jgi:hypothetical protein
MGYEWGMGVRVELTHLITVDSNHGPSTIDHGLPAPMHTPQLITPNS